MIRREEFKINHADNKKNTGIGIAIPFDATSVFKVNYTTKEQVKSNLINLLLTNRGERPFNPNFYADIRRRLFEPDASVDEIKSIISDKINRYIQKITLKNIDVTNGDGIHSIIISINYTVNNQDDTVTIQFQ